MRRKPKSPDKSYRYRSSLRGKTLQLCLTIISTKQIRDLKTLRLGYLHLGPSIEGLEQFTGLEHLYLNSNQIERIPTLAFASNRQLNFLVLSGNRIREIEGLAELPNLQYIDLSKNLIEAVEPGVCLPKSLMFLKLSDNPISAKEQLLSEYRKPFVLALENLVELDKLEVLVAERLFYSGMLPKCNIEKMLKDKLQR